MHVRLVMSLVLAVACTPASGSDGAEAGGSSADASVPDDAAGADAVLDKADADPDDAEALAETEVTSADVAPDLVDSQDGAAACKAFVVAGAGAGKACTSDKECPGEEDSYGCVIGVCKNGTCGLCQLPAGTLCPSGGDPCYGTFKCTGNGYCFPSGGDLCNDGNPCTSDSCVAVYDASGPSAQCHNTGAKYAACSDGDACTVDDHCYYGSCTSMPVECDDGDPCTADSCKGGCQHVALAGTCEQAGGCGVCSSGACAAPTTELAVDLSWPATAIEYFGGVTNTADDGALVIGTLKGAAIGLRVSAAGVVQWQKVWPQMLQGNAVAAAPDGTLRVGGDSKTQVGLVLKVAADGAILTTTGLDFGYPFLVRSTADGGTLAGLGGNDGGFISRLSATGAKLWTTAVEAKGFADAVAGKAGWRVVGTKEELVEMDEATAVWTGWLGDDGKLVDSAIGNISKPKWDIMITYIGNFRVSTGLASMGPEGPVLSALTVRANSMNVTRFVGVRIDKMQGGKLTDGKESAIGLGSSIAAGRPLQDGRFVAGGKFNGQPRLLWLTTNGDVLGQQGIPSVQGTGVVGLAQRSDGQLWVAMTASGSIWTPLRLVRIAVPPLGCP